MAKVGTILPAAVLLVSYALKGGTVRAYPPVDPEMENLRNFERRPGFRRE